MTKKILIADDEPNIVISLEFLMQRNGYEVRTAGDGEAALKLTNEFRPDLILLDIMSSPAPASSSAASMAVMGGAESNTASVSRSRPSK